MRDINVHLNFNKLSAAEFNHHLIPFNLTLEAQRLKVSNLLLSDNCLSTLPWTLQSFRYLYTLYLHRNHLDSLPIWFAPALGHCLRVLTLAENPLRSLPDNLYLLTLLEELYLRDTHLQALPCTLCMLDRLKILDFEACHLTAPQLAFNSGGHESLAARCLQALLHHHCEIAAIPSKKRHCQRDGNWSDAWRVSSCPSTGTCCFRTSIASYGSLHHCRPLPRFLLEWLSTAMMAGIAPRDAQRASSCFPKVASAGFVK